VAARGPPGAFARDEPQAATAATVRPSPSA
jgi:hypothetical protein